MPSDSGSALQDAKLLGQLQDPNGPQPDQVYASAVASFEQLVWCFPEMREYQFALAKCCYQLSSFLMASNQLGEQKADPDPPFIRARDLLRKLAREDTNNLDYRNYLAAVYSGRGGVLFAQARLQEAEESLRKSVEALEPLAAGFHVQPDLRHEQGEAYTSLADVLEARRNSSEAETFYRKAVNVYQELVVSHPRAAIMPYSAMHWTAWAASSTLAAT